VIRGLYSSANGLLVHATMSDVVAGNLAGLSVPAYRREAVSIASFEWALEHAAAPTLSAGPSGPARVLVPSSRIVLKPGPVRHTGAPLDLALEGPGYFCVQTAAGEVYTRAGAFRLDAAGRLTTAAGDPVLGQAGPVQVAGGEVVMAENGDVVVDGARVDRLRLVDFPPGAEVERLGGLLLRPRGGAQTLPAAATQVRQGYLEEANVEAVSEMVALISALRAFEASQRALQASDRTLDRAINDIARV